MYLGTYRFAYGLVNQTARSEQRHPAVQCSTESFGNGTVGGRRTPRYYSSTFCCLVWDVNIREPAAVDLVATSCNAVISRRLIPGTWYHGGIIHSPVILIAHKEGPAYGPYSPGVADTRYPGILLILL